MLRSERENKKLYGRPWCNLRAVATLSMAHQPFSGSPRRTEILRNERKNEKFAPDGAAMTPS